MAYIFGSRTIEDLRSAELTAGGFAAGIVFGHLFTLWSLLYQVGLIKTRHWAWIVSILLLPLSFMGSLGLLVAPELAVAAFVMGSFTGFCLSTAVHACVSRSNMRGLAIPVEAEAPGARER